MYRIKLCAPPPPPPFTSSIHISKYNRNPLQNGSSGYSLLVVKLLHSTPDMSWEKSFYFCNNYLLFMKEKERSKTKKRTKEEEKEKEGRHSGWDAEKILKERAAYRIWICDDSANVAVDLADMLLYHPWLSFLLGAAVAGSNLALSFKIIICLNIHISHVFFFFISCFTPSTLFPQRPPSPLTTLARRPFEVFSLSRPVSSGSLLSPARTSFNLQQE